MEPGPSKRSWRNADLYDSESEISSCEVSECSLFESSCSKEINQRGHSDSIGSFSSFEAGDFRTSTCVEEVQDYDIIADEDSDVDGDFVNIGMNKFCIRNG